MPPCKDTLAKKIERSNYVAYLWKRANAATPQQHCPADHGWCLKETSYCINWYNGPTLPSNLQAHIVVSNIMEENNDGNESEFENEDESDV